MSDSLLIRPAVARDLAAIVDIYNHFVCDTHVTFDTAPFTVKTRQPWFEQFAETGPYRLLVAEDGGEVVGYASSVRFKLKPAYKTSIESSVYMHPEAVGQGHGRALYAGLIEQLCAEPGLHRAYGGVALPNPASIALHERLGFRRVATYHEVGFKFDRYWDVDWFEKDLSG